LGSHGGDPSQWIIGLLVLAVLGVVDDRGLLGQIVHTFLREGGPDKVGGKTFHGPLLMGMDPFAAEDVEPGMSSALHHTDELLGDFASMHEHVKHSMAEEFLQFFELESRGDPEQAFRVKTAVRGQYMQKCKNTQNALKVIFGVMESKVDFARVNRAFFRACGSCVKSKIDGVSIPFIDARALIRLAGGL
jgi:hypothetical protein